ncbi:hypothetical protein [Sodalis sp.]|uniref:hypothetical protein n=1 Tax=Sodalis sp. (in: enterobacteria) TaxID=1898979 RepID=UPI003872A74A
MTRVPWPGAIAGCGWRNMMCMLAASVIDTSAQGSRETRVFSAWTPYWPQPTAGDVIPANETLSGYGNLVGGLWTGTASRGDALPAIGTAFAGAMARAISAAPGGVEKRTAAPGTSTVNGVSGLSDAQEIRAPATTASAALVKREPVGTPPPAQEGTASVNVKGAPINAALPAAGPSATASPFAVAVTPCVTGAINASVAPQAVPARAAPAGERFSDLNTHNMEWDAILTCLAEVIEGTKDAAQSSAPDRRAANAAMPSGSAASLLQDAYRPTYDLMPSQQAQRVSLFSLASYSPSPIPMSRLASFIHPMGYYKFLFERKQDLTEDLDATVRAYYARNEIRRCEAAGWEEGRVMAYLRNFKVHVYSYGKQMQTIPPAFQYLRQNLKRFIHEVELAHDYVRRALDIYFDEIEDTLTGTQNIAGDSSIRLYLSGVLHTQDDLILTQAILRLRYYLISLNDYLRHHKTNILFASSRTPGQPFSYDPTIPLGVTLPNDAGNRVVIMVDNDRVEKHYPMHVTILHEISHIQAGAQDFLFLPSNGQPVDVTTILKQFYDAINNRNGETLPYAKTFVKGYENFCKLRLLTPLEFIERVRADKMLQANIIMDNADCIAQFVVDIGQGRPYHRNDNGTLRHIEHLMAAICCRDLRKLLEKIIASRL